MYASVWIWGESFHIYVVRRLGGDGSEKVKKQGLEKYFCLSKKIPKL